MTQSFNVSGVTVTIPHGAEEETVTIDARGQEGARAEFFGDVVVLQLGAVEIKLDASDEVQSMFASALAQCPKGKQGGPSEAPEP